MSWFGRLFAKSSPPDKFHFVTTPQGEEIHVEKEAIRWSQFHALLIQSAAFRAALTRRLRLDPEPAFYFECTPRFPGTDPIFRFVLVPAPALISRRVDARAFAKHFASGSGLSRTFKNLRGDSTLVVPAPEQSDASFGHLASWLRVASDLQADTVWCAVGAAIGHWSSGPLWLSTSGGGVAWVHIRLDPRPKYYKHAAFRTLTRSD